MLKALVLSTLLVSVCTAQRPMVSVEGFNISCVRTGSSTLNVSVQIGSIISSSVFDGSRFIVSYFEPNNVAAYTNVNLVNAPRGHVSDYGPYLYWTNGDTSHNWISVGQIINGNYFNSTRVVSYMETFEDPLLPLNDFFTVMIWIKPMQILPYRWTRIFGKGSTSRRNFGIFIRYANPTAVMFQFSFGVSRVFSPTLSNYAPPLNQWTHFAGLWNGGLMIMYINGVQVVSSSVSNSADVDSSSLSIGFNTGSGWPSDYSVEPLIYYDGAVTFKKVLSVSQIQEVANITFPSSGFIVRNMSNNSARNFVIFQDIPDSINLIKIQGLLNIPRKDYDSNSTWIPFNMSQLCPRPVTTVLQWTAYCSGSDMDGSLVSRVRIEDVLSSVPQLANATAVSVRL